MAKTLFEILISEFPEIAENKDPLINGTIVLQNDSDGTGDYIAKWNYTKSIPESLAKYLR